MYRYKYIMKWQSIVIPLSLQGTPLFSFVKSPFQAEVVISYDRVKNGVIMCPEGLQLHSPSHECTGVKCGAERHGCKQFHRNNASRHYVPTLQAYFRFNPSLSSLSLIYIIQLNAEKICNSIIYSFKQYIKTKISDIMWNHSRTNYFLCLYCICKWIRDTSI